MTSSSHSSGCGAGGSSVPAASGGVPGTRSAPVPHSRRGPVCPPSRQMHRRSCREVLPPASSSLRHRVLLAVWGPCHVLRSYWIERAGCPASTYSLWSACGSGYFAGFHRAGDSFFCSRIMVAYFAPPPPVTVSLQGSRRGTWGGWDRVEEITWLMSPSCGCCKVHILPSNAFVFAQCSKAAPGPDANFGLPGSLGCFREGRRALPAQGCLS